MKTLSPIFKIISAVLGFLIIPVLLIWVGYAQVAPLFSGEFTQHLGSIEVSYITMAKFIESSLPHLSWQPMWYFGYPMQLLYTPLVPFFEYLSHIISGWSYSHAYRFLTAFSYVGTLITIYFFVRELLKSQVAAFIASLIYGLMPSLLAIMYPDVAQDRFGASIVEPRRFTVLVRWGEGPHIVSLLFLPLAALFWLRFLRLGSKWSFTLGSIFTALTVLTNSIGAWGLVLLIFTIFIGEISEGKCQWLTKFKRSVLMGVVSYGISAFWFSPFFVSNFFREGGAAAGFWRNQFPWGWLLLFGALVLYILISKKLFKNISGVTASILYFLIMYGLVNTYYSSGAEKLELVPQVLRLTTEVDLSLGILVGAVICVISFILRKWRWINYGFLAVVICVGLIIFIPRQFQLIDELPKFTAPLESTGKKLNQTAEYETAMFLKDHVESNERVFVPGNYGFYLNYFTNLTQLRGALFQSSIHYWPDHIYYQIVTGDSPLITLAWLKISNVGWLVMSGPRDIYRDFETSASKFDETLTLIQDNLSDRFYKVPLKNSSLAKVVPESISSLEVPVNAIDETPLYKYVDTLEASDEKLDFREIRNGEYEINGAVGDEELILVQIAYTKGWKAKDDQGRSLDVRKDPLGFILIKPRGSGKRNITLTYSPNLSMLVGWVIFIITLITLSAILLLGKKELMPDKPVVKKEKEDEDE